MRSEYVLRNGQPNPYLKKLGARGRNELVAWWAKRERACPSAAGGRGRGVSRYRLDRGSPAHCHEVARHRQTTSLAPGATSAGEGRGRAEVARSFGERPLTPVVAQLEVQRSRPQPGTHFNRKRWAPRCRGSESRHRHSAAATFRSAPAAGVECPRGHR
jgi:hypothetical protein